MRRSLKATGRGSRCYRPCRWDHPSRRRGLKDSTGTARLDGNDKTYFGYSQRPDYVLGCWAIRYKKFRNFDAVDGGSAWPRVCYSGEYRNAFGSTHGRALLKFLADGRWTPRTQCAFSTADLPHKSHYLEDYDVC